MDYKNDNIMKKFIKFSKSFISNKNILNKTCSQTIIKTNRFMLNNNQKNIDIDDCKVSDTITKNNELITRIKDSVDDNLKHIFNFSYENFLNKESERDCNFLKFHQNYPFFPNLSSSFPQYFWSLIYRVLG